jgi:low temperature requirement protein LtrA
VGWFELFYDLIIVAATLELGVQLAEHPTWPTAGWITLCFTLLFGVWVLTTLHSNFRSHPTSTTYPIIVIQMMGILIACLAANRSGGIDDWHGFIAVAVVLSTVSALYAVGNHVLDEVERHSRRILERGFGLAAIICVIAALLPKDLEKTYAPVCLGLAIAIVAIAALGPYVGDRVRRHVINEEHLSERMGQLILILLGESFLKVVLAIGKDEGRPDYRLLTCTFVIVFSLWALYFQPTIAGIVPNTISRMRVWLLAHVGVGACALGLAVGLSEITILDQKLAITKVATLLIAFPLVVMLLCLAITELATPSPISTTPYVRLATSVAVLIVAAISLYTPLDGPTLFLALVTLVVVSGIVTDRILIKKLDDSPKTRQQIFDAWTDPSKGAL